MTLQGGVTVKRRFGFIIVTILLLTSMVLGADTLIYEANFDKSDSKKVDWVPVVGDWDIFNGGLINDDIVDFNTNIYQELEQSGDYTFIYEYKVTYNVKGGQWAPAAGLHFMCSDGEAVNRGDSYLVFQDYGRIQLYRCSGGGITFINQVEGFPAIEGKTSIMRVEYNVKTGLIKIYLNGTFVFEWTDPSPIYDGEFISCRTNQTAVTYDYIKVWLRK